MMTKGYPELQQLYDLYGAKDKVAAQAWLEYGHQYNVHAREMMYAWFLKHLKGKDEKVKEEAYKPVAPPKDLSVFDDKHPRPKDELNAPKLREAMTKASDEQIAKLAPKDAASLKEFKRVVGTALRAMVNQRVAEGDRRSRRPARIEAGRSNDAPRGVRPEEREGRRAWLRGVRAEVQGREGRDLVAPKGEGEPLREWQGRAAAVKALTDAGFAVVAPDLLGTGENAIPKPFPVDKGFAGYTYGYNRSLLANRVHDALTLVAFGTTMLEAEDASPRRLGRDGRRSRCWRRRWPAMPSRRPPRT